MRKALAVTAQSTQARGAGSDIAEYVSLETNLTDKLGASVAVRHEDYNDFGSTTSGSLAARYDFTDRFALRASASTGFRAPSLAQEDYSQIGSLYLTPSNAGPGIAPGIYQTGLLPVGNPVAQLLGAQRCDRRSRTTTPSARCSIRSTH